MSDILFHQVESPSDRTEAGALIREYLDWLNGRLREYGMAFDVVAMLRSDLSDAHKFHPPDGRFYLARYGGRTAGVGCLKRLDETRGELQRMYVLPAFRGKHLGRAIAERLIEDARSIGYRKLRLESLEFLHAAHALYRSMGFREIDPYADNSMEGFQRAEQLDRYHAMTVFMEMNLESPSR